MTGRSKFATDLAISRGKLLVVLALYSAVSESTLTCGTRTTLVVEEWGLLQIAAPTHVPTPRKVASSPLVVALVIKRSAGGSENIRGFEHT